MRIAALSAVLLVGCASSGVELADAENSWQGATYDEVVRGWGTPARSTRLTDGSNVYTWISEGAGSRGSVSPSVGIGVGSGGGMAIGTGVIFGAEGGAPVRCERTLIFRGGRVAEQNWQGPVEYCGGFRRNTR